MGKAPTRVPTVHIERRGGMRGGTDMRDTGVRRIGDRIEIAVQEIEDFFDSPAGRRLRNLVAGAAIVGAPLLFRLPILRRYPLLRALEVLGGAAIVVKFGEALRDWEPGARRPIVIDVPPR
jgi:hypothetical protein